MITPRKKLGPYEIGVPLGAGSMGKVYRARDTRLNPITPGWSASLTLPDYFRVPRDPGGMATSWFRSLAVEAGSGYKLSIFWDVDLLFRPMARDFLDSGSRLHRRCDR
jgi:hypothetical protein